MRKAISDNTKKRGRPKTTGMGTLVGVRILPELMAQLDLYRQRHDKPRPSRPEAIRRLVEAGLAAKASHEPYSKKSTDRAAEMAERQIDRLSDPSATSEERQSRKRKLLRGPSEFRDMRKKQKR